MIVQATCHGADNRAMADACRASGGRARGVATVRRDVTDGELRTLHEAGVRGVRFNFLKRLVDFTPRDELAEIAGRIQAARLARGRLLRGAGPAGAVGASSPRCRPRSSSTTWAAPTSPSRSTAPSSRLFLRLLREHPNVWTKVSCPERLSVGGPPALNGERHPYRDVVPFARRVVEEFPDRVLWGTDWPHPNLKDHMPDDGLLVDFIPQIAPTTELQQQLLVTNPMRLYWPEEI